MDHCSIKEMVTLQYGSFAALSELVKVVNLKMGCSKRVDEQALRGQAEEGAYGLEDHLLSGVRALPVRVSVSQHCSHAKEGARVTHTKAPHSQQTATAKQMAQSILQ